MRLSEEIIEANTFSVDICLIHKSVIDHLFPDLILERNHRSMSCATSNTLFS